MRSRLILLSTVLVSSVAADPADPPATGRVVFAEDFEAFERKRWNDVANPAALEIVPGGPSGTGSCAQVTATLGKDTGSHLYKMLDPGLDVCHLRFYVKFEKKHEYIHHTENAAKQNSVQSPRTSNRLWFDDIVVSTGPIGPLRK